MKHLAPWFLIALVAAMFTTPAFAEQETDSALLSPADATCATVGLSLELEPQPTWMTSSYSGPCGGSYKDDNGENVCCRYDMRPSCEDGDCGCEYDRTCRDACMPNATCGDRDC